VNLLIGENVPTGSKQLGPIPRTAEKYTVSHDCKLGDYGIQIDAVTGVLMKMPNVAVGGPAAEPFEVTCDLTAHQEPGLNATAVISLRGTHFAYESDLLVMGSLKNAFGPVGRIKSNSATHTCVPSSALHWLKINPSGGMSHSGQFNKMSHLGGLSGSEDLGITGPLVGARCEVAATTVKGTKVKTHVTVVAPQMWTKFTYGQAIDKVTTVSATIGEYAMPLKVNLEWSSGALKALMNPMRFAPSCVFTGNVHLPHVSFSFDVLTGVATLAGHQVFTMGLNTGIISVAPSLPMGKVYDHSAFAKQARRNIGLKCTVYGYYEFHPSVRPYYAKSNQVRITIWDDTCWVKTKAVFSAQNYYPALNTDEKCRSHCRNLGSQCTSA